MSIIIYLRTRDIFMGSNREQYDKLTVRKIVDDMVYIEYCEPTAQDVDKLLHDLTKMGFKGRILAYPSDSHTITRSFKDIEGITSVVRRFKDNFQCIAVVTKSTVSFGMANVFSKLADCENINVGVFRDYQDALNWIYSIRMYHN